MIYKIRFKPKGRKWEMVKGSIIGVYKDFYLIRTPHYKTCVNKKCINTGDIVMEGIK